VEPAGEVYLQGEQERQREEADREQREAGGLDPAALGLVAGLQRVGVLVGQPVRGGQ
jgi:hypothetical protein